VQDHTLNVLHIPPSLDKPHVIRLHRSWPKGVPKEEKHRVFIRKNTQIEEANKYDYDFMYYDRKNIMPEHEVYATINLNSLQISIRSRDEGQGQKVCEEFNGSCLITLENSGRRPISIYGIHMVLALFEDPSTGDYLTITSTQLIAKPEDLILRSQDIKHYQWGIHCYDFNGYDFLRARDKMNEFLTNKKRLYIKSFVLHTTNNVNILIRLTN
jgi:hypothetical protein